MSELEKAKQIAAEAFNFKSKAYTTIEQQNEIIEVNRKAFMQILSLSSLTIPKSIAEILGKYDGYNPTADRLIMMAYRDYQEFNDWIIKDWVKNDNIAKAYLAGKALGVDLVKVVADEN